MKHYTIALLPGDGVGPELLESACRVLRAAEQKAGTFSLTFIEYPFGESAYRELGAALPADTLAGIEKSDASLLGAVSVRGVPPPSPIGDMRRRLDLYADVRLIRARPGVWSLKEGIDIVCIRENTEGFLADRSLYQGHGEWMPSADQALSLRVITRSKCERIAEFAFEYARRNRRRKVTALHKAGVLKMGCGLFLEAVQSVAKGYPDIAFEDEYIDNAANHLIAAPEDYDVILTTNLFGDIISDEAAALVSNIVPTVNIGRGIAVFLPVNHQHRSELAGLGTINPLPTLVCTELLFSHLGEHGAAEMVRRGLSSALKQGALALKSTEAVTALVCAGL